MNTMSEYQPNSHKFKAEQLGPVQTVGEKKKMQKVVTSKVKQKRGLSSIFTVEDVANVKDYIINDVIFPTIKDTIWSVVTNSLDMFMYGGSGVKKGGGKSSASRMSYDRFYDGHNRRTVPNEKPYSVFDYDKVRVEDRMEAEEVLDRMTDAIDTYKVVTVADLYDLVGIKPPNTANKYGWTNLRNARVVRTRDGYAFDLPKALPID
jgi:hypothetical protein